MDLGVLTELGELLDIFKRHLAYEKPIDIVHLGEELADICWYAVNKMDLMSTTAPMILYTPPGRISLPDIFSRIKWYYKCELQTKEKDMLDLCFTIACSYGLDFPQLLENNINKLKVRFPEKFDTEKALNRNLEAERAELEK